MKTSLLTAMILSILAFGNPNTASSQQPTTEADRKREKEELELRILRAQAEKAEAERDIARGKAPLAPEAEAQLRKQIGERALAHVRQNGQEIATGSFP